MKITGSLVVCAGAALFTAGALVFNEGSSSPSPAAAVAPGGAAQVEITGFSFAAAPVAPGSTVVVANRDPEPHTVTASDGAFDTGQIATGTAVSFVAPTVPGTYQFVCAIHPSMHGQLVVA
jgi:plastocyanin